MNRKETDSIKTTRDALSVKLDYLSIVFDKAKAVDVINKLICLPIDIFQRTEGGVRYKEYTKEYSFGQVILYGDSKRTEANPHGLGCYLRLGGVGCSDLQMFLTTRKISLADFFNDCVEYFGEKNFYVTRLDIAIDDRNEIPYFTIEQIKNKCLKGEFIARSRNIDIRESATVHEDSEKAETGKTVYIGKPKSNIVFRFYDKDREQEAKGYKSPENSGSWKRVEMQLRKELAHGIAMYLKDSKEGLSLLAFDFLGENLRFVKADPNQRNKARWKTCRFWERFLGDIKEVPLSIYQPESDLIDTRKWLSVGGCLSAVKLFYRLEELQVLGDLEGIEEELQRVRYSPELAKKAVGHLQRIGRMDLIPLIYEETKK